MYFCRGKRKGKDEERKETMYLNLETFLNSIEHQRKVLLERQNGFNTFVTLIVIHKNLYEG